LPDLHTACWRAGGKVFSPAQQKQLFFSLSHAMKSPAQQQRFMKSTQWLHPATR
jgi:hypothetical protein